MVPVCRQAVTHPPQNNAPRLFAVVDAMSAYVPIQGEPTGHYRIGAEPLQNGQHCAGSRRWLVSVEEWG